MQYFTPVRLKEPEASAYARGIEILQNESIWRLSAIFNWNLRFPDHLSQAATLPWAVTDHMKKLVGVSHGTDVALFRQAVQGGVLATLLYGCKSWYNEHTAENVLGLVQRTISQAGCAVLPAYRTTPITALLRETG